MKTYTKRYGEGEIMTDNLMTPEEVAEKLNVTVNTVREWLRSGELTGVKLGRIWRVRTEDLKAWVESNVQKGE
jgi:excisionase family DNA binding protein